MSSEIEKIRNLSLFQKWVLLRFHQDQRNHIVDAQLITGCCITAMNEDFNKQIGLVELDALKTWGYIRSAGNPQANYEEGFGQPYSSTIDGIIFAKKLMKPVLDAMKKEDFVETIKKLETPEAIATMQNMFHESKTQPQQHILQKLSEFGLRNISGFNQLLILVAEHLH